MSDKSRKSLTSDLINQYEYPEYYYETWINGNKTHVAIYLIQLEQKKMWNWYSPIMEQFIGTPELKKLTNLIDQLKRSRWGR